MKSPHPIPATVWREIASLPSVIEALALASVPEQERGRTLAKRAFGASFRSESYGRSFDTYVVQDAVLDVRPVVLFRDPFGALSPVDYECADCEKPFVRPRCPSYAEEGFCDNCRPGVSCEVCGYCSGMSSNHRAAALCLVCYRCEDCVPVPKPGATDCSCCSECATETCYQNACRV